MSEALRRESAPELLWKPYSMNENGKSSNSRVLMPSNKDNCFQKSEDTLDINGNYNNKFCDVDEKFSEDKENFNRFISSDNFGGHDGDLCKERRDDNCRNSESQSFVDPAVEQRRNSTSDINFRASDFTNANSISLKRSSILDSGAKSMEKMDKINLANLVFNPNFKNSAGCVNLPVIRAGQNLAQKNAQRSSLTSAKSALKESAVPSPKEFSQKTHQAALELLSRQLQPQSLDALAQKLQQLSIQRKSMAGGSADAEDQTTAISTRRLGCSDEIVQTFTGKPQLSQQQQQQQLQPQGNALRYKTELCRSHEEGGECRFGSACTFAHGSDELRPVPRHPLYKTELCRTYHQHGYCQYGTRCHFIHDADETDKNAPLKGCKSWGRHDQLSGAMLSLASSSGLLDSAGAAQQATSSSDNDVLLANLRRLYALRVMNGPEKMADQNTQFSMSQPMSHQLSMAHQQLASAGLSGSQHLPLSMTQPLPMDAFHMGLQRVGQLHPYHQRAPGQLCSRTTSNSRLESMANDYCGWGGAPPPSPAYSGVSPFGSYHQQFSPLPHHQTGSSGYLSHPYSFSATAPDLSAALNMVSPYSMSPQSFSNTVNVGHYLRDQSANYAAASAVPSNYHKMATSSANSQGASSGIGPGVYVGASKLSWPQTSSEVSGAMDTELLGSGFDPNSRSSSGISKAGSGYAGGYPQQQQQQQQQHPYFQPMAAYLQQQPHQHQSHDGSKMAYSEQFKYSYQSSESAPNEKTAEPDLLSLLQGGYSDKYASGREPKTLGTINETIDGSDQSVRPKTRTSLSNVMVN